MKKFIIRVNGIAYEVEVEEVRGDRVAGKPQNRVQPAERPQNDTGLKQVAASEPAAPSGSETVITAPMAGTVAKIFVQAGDMVDAGDVLLILEAMKMENDVMAAVSGKITSVAVSEGKIINAGDVLIKMA